MARNYYDPWLFNKAEYDLGIDPYQNQSLQYVNLPTTTYAAYKTAVGAAYDGATPLNQMLIDFHLSALTEVVSSGITTDPDYWSASSVNGTYIINSGLTASRVGIGTMNPAYALTVSGDVGVNEYIYHNGDADTYLRFAPDLVNLVAGGKSVIKLDESGSNDNILINNTNADIDLYVMGDAGTPIIATDAANDRVGINNIIPNHTLSVSGSVSASTHIYGGGDITIARDLSVGRNLVVTGNTVMNGTLSATTSIKVGNGNGLVSASTLTAGYVSINGVTNTLTTTTGHLNLAASSNRTITLGSTSVENNNPVVIPYNLDVKGTTHITGDTTVGGDVYTDVIRRQSDSSSTTKIEMDDETIKCFGSSTSLWSTKVSSQQFQVGQAGAGLLSAATATISGYLGVSGNTYFPDNGQAIFGDGGDLSITHNSIKSIIKNTTGELLFENEATDADFRFKGVDGEDVITALTLDMADGGTAIFNHDISLADNGQILLGNGDDLKIYHSGSHSIIQDSGTGDLHLKGSVVKVRGTSVSEDCAVFTENGSVELYYDNSKKFETTTDGVSMPEDLTVVGNIHTSGYSYSDNYESLCSGSFKVSSLADGYYGMPGNQGTSNTNWGFEYSNGASGLGNTSQHIGHVVPYDCVLVGVVGKMRASSTGNWSFSLWTADLVDGGNAGSQTWTQSIITVPVNQSNGSKSYGFATTTGTTYLDQGDSIVPAALNGSGTESDVYGSYTIMIKRVQ